MNNDYLYYTFAQNNSGGSYDYNENYGEFTIIAAKSVEEANAIAEKLGIYFDGCEKGLDCECCGDRWFRVESYDAASAPQIYDQSVADYLIDRPDTRVVIHYPGARPVGIWGCGDNSNRLMALIDLHERIR